MVVDVTNSSKEYEVCQIKHVYPKTTSIQELTLIPVMEAFGRIVINLLGPLVTTMEGHRYIVVVTDYLTK